MNINIIEAITKSPLRRSLYHFTRVRNLQAIAHLDGLYSSALLSPEFSEGIRRNETKHIAVYGQSIVLNAHLRIHPEMMDPDTTEEHFRACLDRHVFLWPTERDCLAMANMYSRREPNESFAILQFAAYELLADHYAAIKLSKYDSGSSPRYPHRTSYRKSCRMFLPLDSFRQTTDRLVPIKPSEIKEVLVENTLVPLSKYLQTVYCSEVLQVPSEWRALVKPLLL
ncbi:hypothetical protein H1230_21730 [Paenibacillus sp. 19GGS1-52]|uniref:DUF7002 family protein n=1 Tax=Paenibacillus sp. 19GGS1-52 TaxID=2758563 RepID=UPI001EFC1DCD|nr:hypothetical protein [Paenibacillus sp. 19GGS1-52]ULO05672.1 hypothetical protein H1230_21730 [Paenibacillus sp. 19GGS1-52]